MNMQYIFYTCFIGIALGISIIFLYISSTSKARYIRYAGLAWLMYAGSLVLLTAGMITGENAFILLRNIPDLFNILFLLFCVYAFASRKVPGFWLRFSFYLSIWILVAVFYGFEEFSVSLPSKCYQIIITVMIVYIMTKYWNVDLFEKVVSVCVMAGWGIGISILELFTLYRGVLEMTQFYVVEVLFSNIVCFVILFLYFQKSQEKYEAVEIITRTITENATDVLFLYEMYPSPFFSYITPSISNLLGLEPESFYSDSKIFRDYVDSDDIEKFEDLLSFGGDTNKTATVRIYDQEARMHWCEISTTLITEPDQSPKIEGVIHDVSVSTDAHNQLIRSKEERDILLSYVSHELKTPLTSILGYVTALKDNDVTDDDQRKELLDVIFTKTLTLDKLIGDLVQLSKLETHQFPLNLSLISCTDIADDLFRNHLHDGDERGIEIRIDVSDAIEGKSIIADVDRIDQIMTNLLSNALRYTPKDDKIIIKFDISNNKEDFIFSVTNFGPIIPRDELPYVFDRFYRVKQGQGSASERSSGLGLTISKELILAHNGQISAESTVEHGTTFTVSIPLFDERRY
ncbi:MAG: sensor histidine kinase [Bacillota bacterium]